MRRPLLAVLGTLSLLAACRSEKPKLPTLTDVFVDLPLPPDASFVERRGSPEALTLVMRSPRTLENVVRYYRYQFEQPGWQFISDTKDRDGASVLYVEKAGRPLWIRMSADPEWKQYTLVEMSGAVVNAQADSIARLQPGAAPKAVTPGAGAKDTIVVEVPSDSGKRAALPPP